MPYFQNCEAIFWQKKKIEKVLLPNYVFVKVNSKNKESVLSVNGVLRYVYWLGKPAIIRSNEIDQMKNHLNHFYDHFLLNTNYKIRSGPLKGLSGTVVDISKNNIRLKLDSLGVLVILQRIWDLFFN